MKIKERMARGIRWIKERPLAQKMAQSRPVGQLRRLGASCERNPFPVQMGLVILYRLALDTLYLAGISPVYAYAGFTTDLNVLRYGCSILAVAVFAPFLAKVNKETCASSMLVTLFNYFYFIPLTSLYGCKGMSLKFFLIALLYWAVLLALQFYIPRIRVAPPHKAYGQKGAVLLTVLASGFVLYISAKYTGFRFTLNFIDVYGIRAEAAAYEMPKLFSYALSMMTILLPLLIVYWLQKRRYAIAGILVPVYLLFFSISAQKSQFLFLFLSLACWFFYRPWMWQCMAGLLSGLSGLALLEYKLVGSVYVMSLFFRRMMYLPVWLSERYQSFFTTNPCSLFRDSIMSKFSFENLYTTTIPRIIGEYNGFPDNNANNGLLGDLFANLPVPLGLVMLPLILIICFRLLDAVSSQLQEGLLVAICVLFANSFMNTTWSTVLLTGGFLLACLLLYFFPKKEGHLQ